MPTVDLFPDGTDFNNWDIIGSAGSVHASLADSSISNRVRTTVDGEYFTVTLDNLDSAGLNIDTIDSIQVHMIADCEHRAQTAEYRVYLLDGNNSDTALYTENIPNISTSGASGIDYPWTSRTTSDGSSAWTDSDIDGLKLKVLMYDNPASGEGNVIYMYLTVTYSLPPAPTYTSDDNIVLKNGLVELKNGMIEIKGP